MIMLMQAALANTAIPKVNVSAEVADNEQPEIDISDEEYQQFDTSGVPVIVTLTKVNCLSNSLEFTWTCS